GTEVTGVDATTGTVRTDAGDLTADLVVAADGIHSPTRRALFPGHPDPGYSGVTAWRGLAPKPDTPLRNGETWGRGLVFGAHPLDDETVYFYATDLAPPGEAAEDGKGALLRRVQGCHDPIPELLNGADPGAITRTDL